jgi:hypothetical protein
VYCVVKTTTFILNNPVQPCGFLFHFFKGVQERELSSSVSIVDNEATHCSVGVVFFDWVVLLFLFVSKSAERIFCKVLPYVRVG